jgi:hypothetical protein
MNLLGDYNTEQFHNYHVEGNAVLPNARNRNKEK